MRGRPRRLDPPPPGVTRREVTELTLNTPLLEQLVREWVVKQGLIPNDPDHIGISFQLQQNEASEDYELASAIVSYRKEDEPVQNQNDADR